jgi:hypothetical protein
MGRRRNAALVAFLAFSGGEFETGEGAVTAACSRAAAAAAGGSLSQ